jgi:hypothetical protein
MPFFRTLPTTEWSQEFPVPGSKLEDGATGREKEEFHFGELFSRAGGATEGIV